MEKKESKTTYDGMISDELLHEYIKRIYAGIPYGIKANLGGETQLAVTLFGVSIKENERKREYLRYENDYNLSIADAFGIVYGGVDNSREFGKVICSTNDFVYPLITYHRNVATDEWTNDVVKPYLRPLSSITDSELYDAAAIMLGGVPYKKADGSWYTISHDPFLGEIEQDLDFDYFSKGYYGIKNVDFLNKHHFDYSGLIEKGLAIEAEEGMYNFEKF